MYWVFEIAISSISETLKLRSSNTSFKRSGSPLENENQLYPATLDPHGT